MAEDVYGETAKKISNTIAVNRMRNLFESPNTGTNIKTPNQLGPKGRISSAFSSSSTGPCALNRKDSDTNFNGGTPELPAKTKNSPTLKENTTSNLQGHTTSNYSSSGRSVVLPGGSVSNSVLKTSSASTLKSVGKTESNPSGKKSENITEKMATDSNIPPWKLEIMKRKQQQNGNVVKSDEPEKKETPTSPTKPIPATPTKPTPATPTKPTPDVTDFNSNNVTPTGQKRISKAVDIPDIFKNNDGGEPPIKPLPMPKPKVSPRGIKTPVAAKNTESEKPKVPFKQPSNVNMQDELALKLKRRAERSSESSEQSEETPSLSKSNVALLQQKTVEEVSGFTDVKKETNEGEDSSSIIRRNKEAFQGGASESHAKIFPKRKSVLRKSLTRVCDGMKFYLVNIENTKTTVKAPAMPDKLEISDLKRLREIIDQYKTALAELEGVADQVSGVTEDVDEIYEDIPADMDEPQDVDITRNKSRLSRTVSIIQPMTAEEEEELEHIPDDSDGELYDDTIIDVPPPADLPPPPDDLLKPPLPDVPPPSIPARRQPPLPPPSPVPPEKSQENGADDDGEMYDDTIAETSQADNQEIYEPILDDGGSADVSVSSEQEKSQSEVLTPQEKKKKEKELEKERKKMEKKLEQEKKEELKKLRKFKIEPHDLEKSQMEGTLKADYKPSKSNKLDLEAKQGDRVKIIRLINNPPGKWLVKKLENGKLGYVDSGFVEVDNHLIKNVMEGSYINSLQEYDDGEEYVDVEGVDPPEQDDMYEAV